ncbi:MAG: MarR family transcriptional regulator, organic hydroperoxide resistance regulator [Humisphaera sp.]|nr:MarR family transcriptional regulator, organic hydroperoxide resistance regulator [Humisphaera sp.]
MSLGRDIKKTKPFDALEQEAMLNLARTLDVLAGEMVAEVFKPAELSPTQYNVLRILRGASEPLACGEVADRMIAREPDMTRLLDRLEKRKLVARSRTKADRRVVSVRITDAGMKLLAELDPKVLAAHRRQLGHLGERDLKELIALLEKARERP